VAERNVWVCLVDARGNERIAGETLVAGDRRGPFRSGRFQIRVGNGGARLRVNGEREALPETSVPQNYRVTARGAKLLPQSTGPACEGAAP
jgi:hypothetical protein